MKLITLLITLKILSSLYVFPKLTGKQCKYIVSRHFTLNVIDSKTSEENHEKKQEAALVHPELYFKLQEAMKNDLNTFENDLVCKIEDYHKNRLESEHNRIMNDILTNFSKVFDVTKDGYYYEYITNKVLIPFKAFQNENDFKIEIYFNKYKELNETIEFNRKLK